MASTNMSRGSNSWPKEREYVAPKGSNIKRMIESVKRLNPGPYKCGGNKNTTTKKLPVALRSAVAYFQIPLERTTASDAR